MAANPPSSSYNHGRVSREQVAHAMRSLSKCVQCAIVNLCVSLSCQHVYAKKSKLIAWDGTNHQLQ